MKRLLTLTCVSISALMFVCKALVKVNGGGENMTGVHLVIQETLTTAILSDIILTKQMVKI